MKRLLSLVLCAAMLLSSFVFVANAADADVQAVINAIDAIGEVHRNEALLENQTFNSYMFNALGKGYNGYDCYARIDYPNGGHNVDQTRPQDFLIWDRDFQITFQFVPAETTEGTTPYFGGKIGNKAWVGYNFKSQKFFVGVSDGEGPGAPTRYAMQSAVIPLSSERAYTVTFELKSEGITIYLDGEEVVTTVGQTGRKFIGFKPYDVNNNSYEWKHFIMWPSNCKCYLIGFEAASLDGTKRVNDLGSNLATNGVLQEATFTTTAYVDSGEKIAAAKSAYMALTPSQKKEVTNYSDLVAKMRQYYTFDPVFDGTKISDEALAVVDLIDAIGVVTTASEDDIYCAEVAFEELTPEQQEEVYNYDVLVCSRQEYDAFTDPAIPQLIDDIEALFPVTLDVKMALEAAENTYAAFNSAQKDRVTNYDKLVEARNTYDDLCVERVREIILAIGEVTKDSNEAVSLARTEYNALRDDLKARLADVKPIFDAAKTDMRILNLADLDPYNATDANEISLCENYYEIQSAAAKALVKQKAYLDEKVLQITHILEAREIIKLVGKTGNVNFMKAGGSANGLEFAGKSQVGYSNVLVQIPDGNGTTASLYAPYTVSYDFVISKWLYNEDDTTARIAAYTQDVGFGYNALTKTFMIGSKAAFAGKDENLIGDYAESQVVELKLNVPYNITFEVDETHYAIYLNGKLMVSTDKIGMKRGNYFIFYPGGLDMLVTCYRFIHNGVLVANNLSSLSLTNSDRWSWINNGGGWKNNAVANFENVYYDSGYLIETAYNRYMALDDEYKALVTNSETLLEKYGQYTALKNQQLVADAIASIDAIGEVSLDSIDALTAAEYAYGEVPDDCKELVTNSDVLVAARNTYDQLFGEDLKAQIAAIGDVTAEKIATVEAIKAVYDAMTDAQKAYVDNVDVLNQAIADIQEFYKAKPVVEAINSFAGFNTANYNDATPIGGLVQKTDNNPYIHFSNAQYLMDTGRYQIEYDILYRSYATPAYSVIAGANGTGAILSGVDFGHGLVFIKLNASPFGTYDPENYDAKASFNFRTNRWYHVTVVHDALNVSVLIDGVERVKIEEINSDYNPNSWYIWKCPGGVEGYIDNFSASTLVPEDELDDGFVRTTTQEIGDTTIPETTIGQWNRDNVKNARAMYNALSPLARTAVTNYKTLTDTEKLLRMSAPNDAVFAVIDAINLLTETSAKEDVDAAKTAYDALTASEKNLVTNYPHLEELIALFNSQNVKPVVDAIAALNENSTEADVNAAQEAYDALSDDEKAQVTNYAHIAEVRAILADKAAASTVSAAIDALTAESTKDDLNAVKADYDALSDTAKAYVTNYQKLADLLSAAVSAEINNVIDLIAALTDESTDADFTAAQDAYDALDDAEKAQVTNYGRIAELQAIRADKAAAQPVINAIAALTGESTKEDIEAAKAAYDALSDSAKAYVTNYSTLEEYLDSLVDNDVVNVINLIAALDEDSAPEDVAAAKEAYDALDDDQKAQVTNADHLADMIEYQDKLDAAQVVIDMIFALDENSTPAQLQAAIDAYTALDEDVKALVWNYDTISDICAAKAAAIVADIDKLPDLYSVDIYHFEKDVKKALNSYNGLLDDVKPLVTNYDKLLACKAKIDDLHDWDENKAVNILNSTLAGFGKYTAEDVNELANRTPIGIYYYFEEVDYLELGDSTTGYYSLEGDSENFLVSNEKYAKLELDIKVTDVDLINGYPVLFKMTVNSFDTGYIGYDFVNKCFFYGMVAGGGGAGMDHGYVVTPAASNEYDFDLGIWHHMTMTWDGPHAVIEFDGETVLDCETIDMFDYVIIYPWLCNLEMTNVVLTNKSGKETLSPFRNAVNTPTGWSRSTNDPDSTMLDLVQETIDEARSAYNRLSAEEKEQVVGYENIAKLEALIANVGKYEVAVENGSADADYAEEGDVVTVTADAAPAGQTFDKWEVVSGEIELANENAASTTFTMPASKVELKATYKDIPPYTPADVNGDGKLNSRDVVLVMKAAIPGFEPPASGYVFEAADMNGDGKINSRDIIAVMKEILNQQ